MIDQITIGPYRLVHTKNHGGVWYWRLSRLDGASVFTGLIAIGEEYPDRLIEVARGLALAESDK